jgi:hypothetical protein
MLSTAGNWDWALPTTVAIVITYAAPGSILEAQNGDPPGSWVANSSRAISLSQTGNFLTPQISQPEQAAEGLPEIPLRSSVPTVLVFVRTSRLTWTVYVDGAAGPAQELSFSYGSGATVQLGGSFEGCVLDEYQVYARVLGVGDVISLSSYLSSKWASVSGPVGTPPPPPPRTPAVAPPSLVPPLALRFGNITTGEDTCISGYGSAQTNLTVASAGMYVLNFLVMTAL